MILEILFESQARLAAGTERLKLEIAAPASSLTREQLIQQIAGKGEESLATFLLDHQGQPKESILVFDGDTLLASNESVTLQETRELVITTLISGG